MRILWALMMVLLVVGMTPMAFAAENSSPGKTINIPVKPQPWQVKRAEFLKIVSTLVSSKGTDLQAVAKMDKLLEISRKSPLSITPMEAMDIYGIFYVPKFGEKKMKSILTEISTYATLGWYDALRYGSVSGRVEIINNEKFFLRPFVLSGPKGLTYLKDFMASHPKEADLAIINGTRIARRIRTRERSDQDWPTAYGLELLQCGMQGILNCPKPPAMPEEKWDRAFETAVIRVQKYYQDTLKK